MTYWSYSPVGPSDNNEFEALSNDCGPTDMRARKDSQHRQSENNEMQSNSFLPVELSNTFSPILSLAQSQVNNLRKQMFHRANSVIKFKMKSSIDDPRSVPNTNKGYHLELSIFRSKVSDHAA